MKTLVPTLRRLAIFALTFMTALAYGGNGSFDAQRALTVNVYFDYRETDANMAGKWTDYYKRAAGAWYNALETQSRVKKVYLFNHIPEGKPRADIWTKTNAFWQAYATRNGFRTRALVTFTDLMDPNSLHHVRTFPHELGHYIFDLADCYGGQIRDSAGNKLPLQFFAANQMPDPSLGFRTYMWSDQWVRNAASGVMFEAAPVRVFYNVGGGPRVTSTMDINGPEFASDASHVGRYELRMKIGAYNYRSGAGTAMRPADANFRTYTISNNQEEDNAESEWKGVARYFGITEPASFVTNDLPMNLMPDIVIFDGSSVVICIDKSGSMETENRIGLAKVGAQATVNLFRQRAMDNTPGQIIGITSFDDLTYVDATPREIVTEADRNVLKGAIGGITTDGSTSIGGGLRTSLNQLLGVPNPGRKIKTIILLSDGQHNAGEDPSSVIPDLINTNVVVYTVAIGSGADSAQLASISAQTGGQSFVASSPQDILRYFYTIYSDAAGSGSLHERSVDVPPGQSVSDSVPVESGSDRATFSAICENPSVQFSLRQPNGTLVTMSSGTPGVTFRTAGDQRLFEVNNPSAGTWQMIVSRPPVTAIGPFTKDENPDLAIDDFTPVDSTLTVTDTNFVAGLKVNIDIQHTYIGDLVVRLRSPAGTVVILHNRGGGSAEDIMGTYGGDLVSAQPLSAFNGEAFAGIWTLTVEDLAGGDVGALRSWGIGTGDVSGNAPVVLNAFNDNARLIVNGGVQNANVTYPAPVHLQASLQSGGPVAGAEVFGRVSMPNGGSEPVRLFDDGDPAHGDTSADDGTYSALFDNYVSSGVYEFSITASNQNGFIGGLAENGSDLVPVQPFVRSFTVQATVANVPPVQPQWLVMNKLTSSRVPNLQNRDKLSVIGSFNLLNPQGFDPVAQNLTLRVGNFTRTFLAGLWRHEGRMQRYTQRTPNHTAILDYFTGGGSRCKFTINIGATNVDSAFGGNLSAVPIQLQVGSSFNSAVNVDVDATGNAYKLGSEPATPVFFVDTLSITRNTVRTNSDALVFTARILGQYFFDRASDGISVNFGDFAVVVPAGTFPQPRAGTKLSTRLTQADGSIAVVTFDFDKGLLTIRVTKANLQSIANPLDLNLQLTGVANASWLYRLNLQTLPNNKGFRY